MILKKILVIGGARSGKSCFAIKLAIDYRQPVLFVATAEGGDEEMRQRIEEHRKLRPATWRTLEITTHIGDGIRQGISSERVVIVDCITLLLNNVFNYLKINDKITDASIVEREVMAEISELVDCINQVNASFIIVTNEAGLGIVPANKISRLYRDILGRANQLLAQNMDEIYIMITGIPLKINKLCQ